MAKIPLVDLKANYAAIKDDIDTAIARIIANTSFIGGQELKDFEAAFAAGYTVADLLFESGQSCYLLRKDGTL